MGNYKDTMSMFSNEMGKKNYEALTKEEIYKLLSDYQQTGNIESLYKIILTHTRYITHRSNKYKNNQNLNAEPMDFIQEGVLGLIEAIQRFNIDNEKNVEFLTYATWRIDQHIQKYITTGARFAVSYPVHTYGTISKMEKIQKSANNSIEESLTFEETAKLMGINPVTLNNQLKALSVISFDKPIAENGRTLSEVIADDREKYISEDDKELYDIVLKEAEINLSPREYNIFKKRYIDEEKLTLEEIAQEENTTRERVRQIEEIALGRILLAIKEKYTDKYFKINLEEEHMTKHKNTGVKKVAKDLYDKKIKYKEKRKEIEEKWNNEIQQREDKANFFAQKGNHKKAEQILEKIEQEKIDRLTFSLEEMEIIYFMACEGFTAQDAIMKCKGGKIDNVYNTKTRTKIAYVLFHLAQQDSRILTQGSRWTSLPDRETFDSFLQRYIEQKKTHTPIWVFDVLENYYKQKESIMTKFNINEEELENLKNNALRSLFASPEEQSKITYANSLKTA